MTNFDESKHPRGTGGQFAEKTHSDPTIDLASMNGLTVDQSAAGPLAYNLTEGGLTAAISADETAPNRQQPLAAAVFTHGDSWQRTLAAQAASVESRTQRSD